MTVLVTGIGFVGGHVVRDLLADGHKVVVFGLFGGDDRPDLVHAEALAGSEAWSNVSIVVGDIRDAELIDRTIVEHQVDSVIHLASLISNTSDHDIPRAVEVNVGGSVNIFEAGIRHNLERIVWASSINVYGPKSVNSSGTVDDDSPLDPSTVYGSSKAFVERLAKRYHEKSGLNVVGLRLSKVYGFGEHVKDNRAGGNSWFANLVGKPAMGIGPTVVPFADENLDFQYIEDISRAFVTALGSRNGAGETFVTTGDSRPIREAFEFVKSLLPDAQMTLTEGAEAANMPSGGQINWSLNFDASRAREILGIEPRFPMEAGLLKTINEYRIYAGLPPVAHSVQ